MSNDLKVPNGKICYLEIPSNNIQESVEFYKSVFGWNIRKKRDGTLAFDDVPNGVSGTWTLNRKVHVNSVLILYIMVDNIVETIDKITAAGGILAEPVSGKEPELIAKFLDPFGNIFGISQE